MASEACFIGELGAGRLLWLVFRRRVRQLYVNYTRTGTAAMLAALLRGCGVALRVQELDFDFIDEVRLPTGKRAIDEVYFHAAPQLLGALEKDPRYAEALKQLARRPSHVPFLQAAFSKRLFFEICPFLRSILVTAWYAHQNLPGRGVFLYAPPHRMFEALSDYARRWGIQLCPLPAGCFAWDRLVRKARRRVRNGLQRIRQFFLALAFAGRPPAVAVPRIAVEMYLKGVRRQPLYHTEFFWYRKPSLPPETVFGYFLHPQDQPTPDRQADLKAGGIGWIDRATALRLMETPLRDSPPVPAVRGQVPSGWAGDAEDFYFAYDRWVRFFQVTGTRIHVSSSDIFPESEALHAALADTGGVSVSLQLSLEREAYRLRQTVTDVHFAFSRRQAESEQRSGSLIRQFVVAGYPFDSIFPEVRAHAQRLAQTLRRRGATFIVCYFDENEGIHRKWLGGRRQIQGDYRFLCDRLEEDPSLGLLLKPKRAETLPQRLELVWGRLERLLREGRCLLLGCTGIDDRYLPCVGACAADLSINLIGGATAGLESVLAGTPTLLLRHGVDLGPFGQLPEGSVVFDTWEALWRAVERFRADRSDPQIGNWEPIVEQFASLRDGRGSERIHQYLVWLYQAFASGKDREQALEEARQRYEAKWGPGWITAIGPEDPRPAATPVMEGCPA